MNITEIVKQLKSEREGLTKAIVALEGIQGGSQGAQVTALSQLKKPRLANTQPMV
jgi:hypothetical protein